MEKKKYVFFFGDNHHELRVQKYSEFKEKTRTKKLSANSEVV